MKMATVNSLTQLNPRLAARLELKPSNDTIERAIHPIGSHRCSAILRPISANQVGTLADHTKTGHHESRTSRPTAAAPESAVEDFHTIYSAIGNIGVTE
jgi:hypothetical protein